MQKKEKNEKSDIKRGAKTTKTVELQNKPLKHIMFKCQRYA